LLKNPRRPTGLQHRDQGDPVLPSSSDVPAFPIYSVDRKGAVRIWIGESVAVFDIKIVGVALTISCAPMLAKCRSVPVN
jgi:hypothetical protein